MAVRKNEEKRSVPPENAILLLYLWIIYVRILPI